MDHGGKKWAYDQAKSAAVRRSYQTEPLSPTPLIPGVDSDRTYLPKLPEADIRDQHGHVIQVEAVLDNGGIYPVYVYEDRRAIRSLTKLEVEIDGFCADLNRPATSDETGKIFEERLAWANMHCTKVGSDIGGSRKGTLIQYRAAQGAAEQCYGLLGLDLTIAWRMGVQQGLLVEPWLEKAVTKGVEILRRVYNVEVLSGHFHPGNLYLKNGELGFGSHVQFYTVRAFGGRWLTKERDFRRLGPATVGGLHLVRMGVDAHAHARARYEADLKWLYEYSTEIDWRRLSLQSKTTERIKNVQSRTRSGTSTIVAEIARDLKKWDKSWQTAQHKSVVEVYGRNLSAAQKNQPPVDWVLSNDITRALLGEMAADPVWAPIVESAKRCALEIENEHYRRGFSVSLTNLILEWEAREDEAARKREHDRQVAAVRQAAEDVATSKVRIVELEATVAEAAENRRKAEALNAQIHAESAKDLSSAIAERTKSELQNQALNQEVIVLKMREGELQKKCHELEDLMELNLVLETITAYNPDDPSVVLSQEWFDEGLIQATEPIVLGSGFSNVLSQITMCPREVQSLKNKITALGFRLESIPMAPKPGILPEMDRQRPRDIGKRSDNL